MSEMLPGMLLLSSIYMGVLIWDTGLAGQAPVFASNDAVPFRFTPNMQRFLGPVFTEGLLTTGIMVIGRCLTEPEVCPSLP